MKKTMTDEEIEQWIYACNSPAAKNVLRDYIKMRKEAITPKPENRKALKAFHRWLKDPDRNLVDYHYNLTPAEEDLCENADTIRALLADPKVDK